MSTNYTQRHDNDLLFLTDERIKQHIELLFFAYRDFTADPDRILNHHELGRAHHRALYFIKRRPGLTVSELLAILSITKQSLNRVLRKLIELDYVQSTVGEIDRRERNLNLTEKGEAFENELAHEQQMRFRNAFSKAGPEAIAGFRKVLVNMLDDQTLSLLDKSLKGQ